MSEQYIKTPTCFGTLPKHVGVIIIVMNCILLSAFVGAYIDWKNMCSMNNIKFAYGGVKGIANLVTRLRFGVSLMPRRLYSQENGSRYPQNGKLGNTMFMTSFDGRGVSFVKSFNQIHFMLHKLIYQL